MSDKTEGTIVLDGLIEGRLPDDPSIEDKLEQWLDFVGQLGLRFNLEVTGSSFSLLPDSTPVPVSRVGDAPQRSIQEALEQLFQAFSTEARSQVFSTLRSVEYRPGEEVQSLYAALPDGSVKVETRHVDAQTTAPPRPMTTGERVRAAVFVALVLLAVFGVSSLFVDWGGIVGQFANTVRPINAEQLDIQASAFEGMMTVEGIESHGSPKGIKVTLKRGEAFPLDERAAAEAIAAAPESIERRLAVEALVRGYIVVELFDDQGAFLGAERLRIARLHDQEQIELLIEFPQRRRVSRVTMQY